MQKNSQRDFTFILNSIGPASITIQRFNTLSSCELKYAKTNLENQSIIRLATWAFDDWPLSVRSNVSHSTHNVTTIVEKIFDYLVSASIHLPRICTPSMTRVQMALFLRQSSCKIFQDLLIRQMLINNISGLM